MAYFLGSDIEIPDRTHVLNAASSVLGVWVVQICRMNDDSLTFAARSGFYPHLIALVGHSARVVASVRPWDCFLDPLQSHSRVAALRGVLVCAVMARLGTAAPVCGGVCGPEEEGF